MIHPKQKIKSFRNLNFSPKYAKTYANFLWEIEKNSKFREIYKHQRKERLQKLKKKRSKGKKHRNRSQKKLSKVLLMICSISLPTMPTIQVRKRRISISAKAQKWNKSKTRSQKAKKKLTNLKNKQLKSLKVSKIVQNPKLFKEMIVTKIWARRLVFVSINQENLRYNKKLYRISSLASKLKIKWNKNMRKTKIMEASRWRSLSKRSSIVRRHSNHLWKKKRLF